MYNDGQTNTHLKRQNKNILCTSCVNERGGWGKGRREKGKIELIFDALNFTFFLLALSTGYWREKVRRSVFVLSTGLSQQVPFFLLPFSSFIFRLKNSGHHH